MIISNILCFIGTSLTGFSSFFKTKSSILKVQIFDYVLNIIGYLCILNIPAIIAQIIGLIRTILNAYEKMTNLIIWSLIILGMVLGIKFNNNGLIGFLPIIASIITSLITTYCKNPQYIRLEIIITMILYIVFSIFIKLYLPIIVYVIVAISSLISMIKYRKVANYEK